MSELDATRPSSGPLGPSASAPPVLPEPPFERARALELMDGSEQLWREVLAVAVPELESLLATLDRSLAGGAVDAAQRAAHTIKGLCGSLAAEPAHRAAAALELAVSRGDLGAAAALQPEFAGAVAALIEAIESELGSP